MPKKYLLLFFCFVFTNYFTYCMDNYAFEQKQEHESTPPSPLEMLLANLNNRTRNSITDWLKKLQEQSKAKNPRWPILLCTTTENLVKNTAIQLGHEIARTPLVVTYQNFRNTEACSKLDQDVSNNEPHLLIFFDFKEIYKQYCKLSNNNSLHTSSCINALLLRCVKKNPIIIINNNINKQCAYIRALLDLDLHNREKKILRFHYTKRYNKQQTVTNWCKKKAIDYVYTISTKRLPPGLYKHPFRIISEITNTNEIVSTFAQFIDEHSSLTDNDWQSILSKITIKKINIDRATPNTDPKKFATFFKILNESGISNLATIAEYKAAIDLDNVKKLITEHSKK